DLRTPLTRMHARLEKAHDQPRDSARDQALISDTMGDLSTVLGMFSSLLRIAQIEGNSRSDAFCTVNLAEIAGDVVELFDAAAEESKCRAKSLSSSPVIAIFCSMRSRTSLTTPSSSAARQVE